MLNSQLGEEQVGWTCAIADSAVILFAFEAGGGEVITMEQARVPDRRVARTQKLLRASLHSLIREKDYDSIAVKEILDRADVGRSVFYTHFRDKDELLASSIHDILGSVPPTHSRTGEGSTEGILWFSLPIFEHLDRHRRTGELKLGLRGRTVLHGHLQKVLAELIAKEVRRNHMGRSETAAGFRLVFLSNTLPRHSFSY